MMEDEIKSKRINGISQLLLLRSFTYSVLALRFLRFVSFPLASTPPSTFSSTTSSTSSRVWMPSPSTPSTSSACSIATSTSSTSSLPSSSTATCASTTPKYLHLLSPLQIMNNIVDYAVWESSSDVWKYLGTPKVFLIPVSSLDAHSRRRGGAGAPSPLSHDHAHQRHSPSAGAGRGREDDAARQGGNGRRISHRPGS